VLRPTAALRRAGDEGVGEGVGGAAATAAALDDSTLASRAGAAGDPAGGGAAEDELALYAAVAVGADRKEDAGAVDRGDG
jgi:hypothetical protein